MRSFSKITALLVLLLMGTGTGVGAQVSIGIRIGAPPAPRVLRVQPRSPGANFVWIQGYWYPVQNRYVWHNGYWTQPPYQGARWVGPQYSSQQYYAGYWEGEHGRSAHDHRTDRAKERDFPGRGRQ